MPFSLEIAFSIIYVATIFGLFFAVITVFKPSRLDLQAKAIVQKNGGMHWLVYMAFLGFPTYSVMSFSPNFREWVSTPVVATFPNEKMLVGRWSIDPDGTGRVRISNGTITCSQMYDARNSDFIVEVTGKCSVGGDIDLRVARYGSNFKDRGEGVWRQADQYGWYIFGWKARLAILTNGIIGIPDHAPNEQDFIAVGS